MKRMRETKIDSEGCEKEISLIFNIKLKISILVRRSGENEIRTVK